jgi:hypothetical protein
MKYLILGLIAFTLSSKAQARHDFKVETVKCEKQEFVEGSHGEAILRAKKLFEGKLNVEFDKGLTGAVASEKIKRDKPVNWAHRIRTNFRKKFGYHDVPETQFDYTMVGAAGAGAPEFTDYGFTAINKSDSDLRHVVKLSGMKMSFGQEVETKNLTKKSFIPRTMTTCFLNISDSNQIERAMRDQYKEKQPSRLNILREMKPTFKTNNLIQKAD